MPSTQGHKREAEALEGIEEALRCLTLIGHVPRSENTWADRCQAATEPLHRARQALSNPVRGEGERWTIEVCRSCGRGPNDDDCPLSCDAGLEEVEVVRADEGPRLVLQVLDKGTLKDIPADEDSQGEGERFTVTLETDGSQTWEPDFPPEGRTYFLVPAPSKGSE